MRTPEEHDEDREGSVAASDSTSTSGERTGEVLLDVQELSAAYGGAVAVESVTLRVHEGECVGVVGANGAGKTTTLRALSRLHPSGGTITFAGEPLPGSTVGAVKAGLVQCPERRRLFPQLSVKDNLAMGGYRLGRSGGAQEDYDRVFELFPRLGERQDQKAGTMSGGEQQQCAIGRALMARPRLLLLDEPTMGLSVGIKEVILDSLQAVKDSGVTMLLVEQDVSFALRAADRLAVLEHGTVAQEGPAKEVGNDPRVREAYLGVS